MLIKTLDINSTGEKNIWVPSQNKRVILERIEMYGYCQATISNPFVLDITMYIGNIWKKTLGVKAISSENFVVTRHLHSDLKTDPGNGSSPVLKVNISTGLGNDTFDFTVVAFGNEF